MSDKLTLARPYAKACYDLAVEQQRVDHWHTVLIALRDKNYDAISDEQALNLVKLLAENKRLALLPEIVAVFEKIKAEAEKVMTVVVTTAFALDKSGQERAIAALKQQLRCEIVSDFSVDPDLIGGAVVRLGEAEVMDASLKTQLSRLRKTLVIQ
jgi:F-type H+-transporting ATPase subunit delta